MDPADAEPNGLTDVEKQMLAFEEHWWKHAGVKETSIRAQFDMSTTRYY